MQSADSRVSSFGGGLTVGVPAFDVGDGLALLLRVSVGIAQWRMGENMSDLIERADIALYDAKERGRNRVEVAP